MIIIAKRPIEHDKSAFVNKEIISILKLKKIAPEISDTKKDGVKEMLKIVFENPEEGITVTITGKKSTSEFRNWDRRMFDNKEDIHLTLSVPSVKQTSITDDFIEPEEE